MDEQVTRISATGGRVGRVAGLDRRQAGFVSVGVALVVTVAFGAFALGQGTTNQLLRLLEGHLWLANAGTNSVSLIDGATGRADAVGLVTLPAGSSVASVIDVGGSLIILDNNGQAHLIDASKGFAEQQDLDANGIEFLTGSSGSRVWEARFKAGQGQARLPITQEFLAVGTAQNAGGEVFRAAAAVADDDSLVMAAQGTGSVTTMTPDSAASQQLFTPGAPVKMATVGGKPVLIDFEQSVVVTLSGDKRKIPFPRTTAPFNQDAREAGCESCGTLALSDGNSLIVVDLNDPAGSPGRIPVDFPVKNVVVREGDVFVSDQRDTAYRIDLTTPDRKAKALSLPNGEAVVADDIQVRGGDVYLNNSFGNNAATVPEGSDKVNPVEKTTPESLAEAAEDKQPDQQPEPAPEPRQAPVPEPVAGDEPGNGPSNTGRGTTGSGDRPKQEAGIPGAPSFLRITAGKSKADLEWGKAAANGSAVKRYIVTQSRDGGPEQALDPIPASRRTQGVGNLDNEVEYCFSVAAQNGVDTGPAVRRCATPSQSAPNPPSSVTATATDGQIAVEWTDPTPGGTAASLFEVELWKGRTQEVLNGTAVSMQTPPRIPSGDKNGIPFDSGIENGVVYTITVTTIDAENRASTPALSDAVRPVGSPSPPIFDGESTGDKTASITFLPPASTGGTDITISRYRVTISSGGEENPTSAGTVPFSGLTNGTPYTVRVIAVNSEGKDSAPLERVLTPNRRVFFALDTWNPFGARQTCANGSQAASLGSTVATQDFTVPDGMYVLETVKFYYELGGNLSDETMNIIVRRGGTVLSQQRYTADGGIPGDFTASIATGVNPGDQLTIEFSDFQNVGNGRANNYIGFGIQVGSAGGRIVNTCSGLTGNFSGFALRLQIQGATS